MDPKYSLPETPEFMAAIDLQYELPDYSEQGEARGRRPQKPPSGDVGSKKSRKTKSKAGKKSRKSKTKKGKTGKRAKLARVTRAHKTAESAASAVELSEGGGKKRRKTKATAAVPEAKVVEEPKPSKRKATAAKSGVQKKPKGQHQQPVEDEPKTIEKLQLPDDESGYFVPEDCYDAPATATTNMVYSCAYSRAKKLYPEKSEWQRHAKWATWVLRTHKKISPYLSGRVASKKVAA